MVPSAFKVSASLFRTVSSSAERSSDPTVDMMTDKVPERRLLAAWSSESRRLARRSLAYCSSKLRSTTNTRGGRWLRPVNLGGVIISERTLTGMNEPSDSLSISVFSDPSTPNGRRWSSERSKVSLNSMSLISMPITFSRMPDTSDKNCLLTCRTHPSGWQTTTASLVISTKRARLGNSS